MANIINYHYSPKDERWVTGLAVLDKVDREQNKEKIYVIPNPNLIYVKLTNGFRGILDITGKIKKSSYQDIVLKPGEYSFNPNNLHESFDDLEYWLSTVFPKGSLSKLREILGELIFPTDNRNIIINFVLTEKNDNKKLFNVLKKQIKLILGFFPFDMQNVVDNVTKTTAHVKTETYRTKGRIRRWIPGQGRVYESGMVTRIRYNYSWDINYTLKDWYRVSEPNNSTNQRFIVLNNEHHTGYGYRRRRLNNCPADTLARQFEHDTFIDEYIRQIKPKKYVLKYYGVDPIRIVKCKTTFPTIISYTYNEPLDKIKIKEEKNRQLFRVFQLKAELSHNFDKNQFATNMHELTDKLHRWVLNGIIIRRNKAEREDIGLVNIILDKPEPVAEEQPILHFMRA